MAKTGKNAVYVVIEDRCNLKKEKVIMIQRSEFRKYVRSGQEEAEGWAGF